jgi:predicted Zn finger-like uncharacterized protein
MILTCPQCASRYVVDARRIPPQGRTVRCSSCGDTWRAQQDFQQEQLEPPPPRELAPDTPRAAETELELTARSADVLPKTFRAKQVARDRTRKAVAAGAVWGVLGALALGVLGAAVLFRVDVVRLWPRTAGAYAAVGLAVNPTGLAPENVHAAPGLKDGHAAVIVTGHVRNVELRPHDPAPLKVSLLDKSGKPLAMQVVELAPGKLEPGKTRAFTLAFLDPPSASADVQVEFMFDPPKREKHATIADNHEPLRGAAQPHEPPPAVVKAAEALPADSPYALPSAAVDQGAGEHHGHDG